MLGIPNASLRKLVPKSQACSLIPFQFLPGKHPSFTHPSFDNCILSVHLKPGPGFGMDGNDAMKISCPRGVCSLGRKDLVLIQQKAVSGVEWVRDAEMWEETQFGKSLAH